MTEQIIVKVKLGKTGKECDWLIDVPKDMDGVAVEIEVMKSVGDPDFVLSLPVGTIIEWTRRKKEFTNE